MAGFLECAVSCLSGVLLSIDFVFFKQKTAYEMRISDWSSDVCSSDLAGDAHHGRDAQRIIDDIRPLLARTDREDHPLRRVDHRIELQIGRASCRERVCPYV